MHVRLTKLLQHSNFVKNEKKEKQINSELIKLHSIDKLYEPKDSYFSNFIKIIRTHGMKILYRGCMVNILVSYNG